MAPAPEPTPRRRRTRRPSPVPLVARAEPVERGRRDGVDRHGHHQHGRPHGRHVGDPGQQQPAGGERARTVTVPAGATSATFPIATTAVAFTQSATIDATYAGTLQAKLTVTAPVAGQRRRVSIGRAEYDTAKRQLRVDATSSGSGAILRVYFTGTDTLIGTLSGGSGQFTVSVNPVDITVRSSLGGTAARAVTAK